MHDNKPQSGKKQNNKNNKNNNKNKQQKTLITRVKPATIPTIKTTKKNKSEENTIRTGQKHNNTITRKQFYFSFHITQSNNKQK